MNIMWYGIVTSTSTRIYIFNTQTYRYKEGDAVDVGGGGCKCSGFHSILIGLRSLTIIFIIFMVTTKFHFIQTWNVFYFHFNAQILKHLHHYPLVILIYKHTYVCVENIIKIFVGICSLFGKNLHPIKRFASWVLLQCVSVLVLFSLLWFHNM